MLQCMPANYFEFLWNSRSVRVYLSLIYIKHMECVCGIRTSTNANANSNRRWSILDGNHNLIFENCHPHTDFSSFLANTVHINFHSAFIAKPFICPSTLLICRFIWLLCYLSIFLNVTNTTTLCKAEFYIVVYFEGENKYSLCVWWCVCGMCADG